MSYKPLTDDELNDSKPGPKGMLPRDLGFLDYLAALEEQSRRANRLAEYLASALSEPSVRLEMLSFNMGVETINALAAYQGREGET